MSHHLGISHHLPSFSRRLSSSYTSTPKTPSANSPSTSRSPISQRSSNNDSSLTTDNKDVLIERLKDLISRLSSNQNLEDAAVSAIHAQVDRIEGLVREENRLHPRINERENEGGSRSTTPNSPSLSHRGEEDDGFWGPASPSLNFIRIPPPPSPTSVPLPKSPTPKCKSKPESNQKPRMSIARAVELANGAELLATNLATTLAALQARREESSHIHDLLLTRVEAAASRILFLEWRVAEMEDDFAANESELRYLKIGLRAIQAQSVPVYGEEEDRELRESIGRWKTEWEDIDRRTRKRRGKYVLPKGSVGGGSMAEGESMLSSVRSP